MTSQKSESAQVPTLPARAMAMRRATRIPKRGVDSTPISPGPIGDRQQAVFDCELTPRYLTNSNFV